MATKSEKDRLIEQYEKKQKEDRIQKIVLLIIIILLLLLFIVCYRMGRISYRNVVATPAKDSVQLIQVSEDDMEITKDTQLDIFINQKFNNQKIIAPKSNGSYSFCVENVSGKDVIYAINFKDEMKYLVNMKYRLKIDNAYVRGNDENYVSIEDLNLEDLIVLKDSINVFTLEWYWEDDDKNDTIVGSQKVDQYYTLNLEILAEEYIR